MVNPSCSQSTTEMLVAKDEMLDAKDEMLDAKHSSVPMTSLPLIQEVAHAKLVAAQSTVATLEAYKQVAEKVRRLAHETQLDRLSGERTELKEKPAPLSRSQKPANWNRLLALLTVLSISVSVSFTIDGNKLIASLLHRTAITVSEGVEEAERFYEAGNKQAALEAYNKIARSMSSDDSALDEAKKAYNDLRNEGKNTEDTVLRKFRIAFKKFKR